MSPARPPGFTLWLTGLSGAGKSTIAERVRSELEDRGRLVEVLDGDQVRAHLSPGLGFSKADRDTHILRLAWVASRLTRAGVAVVVAAISPYRATRQAARALIETQGAFVEVFVAASVETCARRDPKGLYARARAGELRGFTGVDDPYESPLAPELVVDTETGAPRDSAAQVLALLGARGLLG